MIKSKVAFDAAERAASWGVKKITGGKFSAYAEYIGTFFLIYCGLGGGFIGMCLFLGINPTLVVSVKMLIVIQHLKERKSNEVIRSNYIREYTC